jgi:hypothetical protein
LNVYRRLIPPALTCINFREAKLAHLEREDDGFDPDHRLRLLLVVQTFY